MDNLFVLLNWCESHKFSYMLLYYQFGKSFAFGKCNGFLMVSIFDRPEQYYDGFILCVIVLAISSSVIFSFYLSHSYSI